jgi:hypothetical protein
MDELIGPLGGYQFVQFSEDDKKWLVDELYTLRTEAEGEFLPMGSTNEESDRILKIEGEGDRRREGRRRELRI